MRLACLLPFVAACGAVDAVETANPNAGLLRDFQDGKFDSAGHPLNAQVVDGKTLCGATRLTGTCVASLPGGAQQGALAVNVHARVTKHAASGDVLAVAVRGGGEVLGSDTLTVERLRDDEIDLPVGWTSSGGAVTIELAPAAGAEIELAYVEVFPSHFGIVIAPGSGVVDDAARLTIEVPRAHAIDALTVDGIGAIDLDALIDRGLATKTTTALRTVIEVGVGDLLPDRGDVAELHVNAGADAARVELRRTAPACAYEGAGDRRVLVTGFQPFPADGWHDNVSGVAVTAMDPRNVHARVMRLVLPVEYDRAAAEVADAIARCAPDVVISFGQGGGAIALEHTAYNLQDTGEVAGGVPDNRGIVRVAQPIDDGGPAERATLLPVDAIEQALVAIGEAPEHSTDPGRYICNNVMYQDIAHMAERGGRGGFIHLPYTTSFDDATRARFGRVVETAIAATLAN